MKVRNIIINNWKNFMDLLERELCRYGISYVRIDNEIHFQDQIVRLYNPSELINNMLPEREISEPKLLIDLDALEDINKPFKIEQITPYVMKKEYLVPKEIPKYNRNKQKQDSKKVNMLLKKYKK